MAILEESPDPLRTDWKSIFKLARDPPSKLTRGLIFNRSRETRIKRGRIKRREHPTSRWHEFPPLWNVKLLPKRRYLWYVRFATPAPINQMAHRWIEGIKRVSISVEIRQTLCRRCYGGWIFARRYDSTSPEFSPANGNGMGEGIGGNLKNSLVLVRFSFIVVSWWSLVVKM